MNNIELVEMILPDDEEDDEETYALNQVEESEVDDIANILIADDISSEYILPDSINECIITPKLSSNGNTRITIDNDHLEKISDFGLKPKKLELIVLRPSQNTVTKQSKKNTGKCIDSNLDKLQLKEENEILQSPLHERTKVDKDDELNQIESLGTEENSALLQKQDTTSDMSEQDFHLNKIKKKTKRPYRLHVCDVCGKEYYNDNSFRNHLITHREPKFLCELCDRKFKQRSNLNKHVAAVHSEVRPYQCHMCGASFKRIDVLKEHIKRVHEGKKGRKLDKSSEALQSDLSKIRKRYECPYCYKCLTSKSYWQDHINGHTKKPIFTCQECGLTFSRKASYRYHYQRAHVEKKRTCEPRGTFSKDCEYCGLHFRIKKCYDSHITSKHFNKFLCHHCDEYFDDKLLLQNHMEVDHYDEVVRCEYCGKVYPEIYHLRRHIYLCHNENRKRYWCDNCGHESTKKSSLVLHMRKHTKEKPYECEFCKKRYAQEADFRKHRITHFRPGLEEPKVTSKTAIESKKNYIIKKEEIGKLPAMILEDDKSEDESCEIRIVEISSRLGSL